MTIDREFETEDQVPALPAAMRGIRVQVAGRSMTNPQARIAEIMRRASFDPLRFAW